MQFDLLQLSSTQLTKLSSLDPTRPAYPSWRTWLRNWATSKPFSSKVGVLMRAALLLPPCLLYLLFRLFRPKCFTSLLLQLLQTTLFQPISLNRYDARPIPLSQAVKMSQRGPLPRMVFSTRFVSRADCITWCAVSFCGSTFGDRQAVNGCHAWPLSFPHVEALWRKTVHRSHVEAHEVPPRAGRNGPCGVSVQSHDK